MSEESTTSRIPVPLATAAVPPQPEPAHPPKTELLPSFQKNAKDLTVNWEQHLEQDVEDFDPMTRSQWDRNDYFYCRLLTEFTSTRALSPRGRYHFEGDLLDCFDSWPEDILDSIPKEFLRALRDRISERGIDITMKRGFKIARAIREAIDEIAAEDERKVIAAKQDRARRIAEHNAYMAEPIVPGAAPYAAPVAAPAAVLVSAPVTALAATAAVTAPAAVAAAPVAVPIAAPVDALVSAHVTAPVTAPVIVPIAVPVAASVAAPVDTPIAAHVATHVAASTATPVTAPTAAPVVPVEPAATTIVAPVDATIAVSIASPVTTQIAAPTAVRTDKEESGGKEDYTADDANAPADAPMDKHVAAHIASPVAASVVKPPATPALTTPPQAHPHVAPQSVEQLQQPACQPQRDKSTPALYQPQRHYPQLLARDDQDSRPLREEDPDDNVEEILNVVNTMEDTGNSVFSKELDQHIYGLQVVRELANSATMHYHTSSQSSVEDHSSIDTLLLPVKIDYGSTYLLDEFEALARRDGPDTSPTLEPRIGSQVLVYRERGKSSGPWTLLSTTGETCTVDQPSGAVKYHITSVRPYRGMPPRKTEKKAREGVLDQDSQDAHYVMVETMINRRRRGRLKGFKNRASEALDYDKDLHESLRICKSRQGIKPAQDAAGIVSMQTDGTPELTNARFDVREKEELQRAAFPAKRKKMLDEEHALAFNGCIAEKRLEVPCFRPNDQSEHGALVEHSVPSTRADFRSQRARGAYVAMTCQPEAQYDLAIAAQLRDLDKKVKLPNDKLQWQKDNSSRGLSFLSLKEDKIKLLSSWVLNTSLLRMWGRPQEAPCCTSAW